MTRGFRRALLAMAVTTVFADQAMAAGFQLQNQTGSGNGNAFAGAAAAAEDAGTIFFNPAGMTRLPEGHSFAVAGTVLSRSVKFTNTGSTNPTNPPTTSNGKDAGGTSLIPAFYWSYAVDPSLRVGLGVSPTFGNTTDYGFNFVGRNAGYYAKITQMNVNPSIAYKASDVLSVGFGLNYATNDTLFRQGYPLAPNGSAEIKGEDSAFGYNLGLMLDVAPDTRVALAYRSELKFKLDGYLDVNLTPTTPDARVTAKLSTPASTSLALSHKLNPETELLADVTWTSWSVINSIDLISKADGTTKLNSLSYNFKDTVRYGLGVNYQYSDTLKLRFGTAFDQSPVKSAADRTMTLPDSDRTWLAFGAKYKIDEASSIDIGYAHIFFAGATAQRAAPPGGAVVGKWSNSADLLSVQWNYSYK